MRRVELFFNYKYTFRFLISNSILDVVNNFNLPSLQKIVCFFPLRELSDLNDVRIYNYCFFFKFFFGIKPFFTRCLDVSTFKKVEYSFSIQAILRKYDMYLALNFFFNDVLPFMGRRGFSIYVTYVNSICNVVYKVDKFNIFLSKKANLGLLNLVDPFSFKIYMKGLNFLLCRRLMYFFKM